MSVVPCSRGSGRRGVVSPYLERKDSTDTVSWESCKLVRVLSLSSPMFSGKKEKGKLSMERGKTQLLFPQVAP